MFKKSVRGYVTGTTSSLPANSAWSLPIQRNGKESDQMHGWIVGSTCDIILLKDKSPTITNTISKHFFQVSR